VYTQCSKCETVFKLSAEVLRAAGGQVRCGKCGEVFNALSRLAEEPTAFTAGESSLELETRADSILESAVALKIAEAVAKDYEDYAPPGVEIAQLQVLDWSEDDQDFEVEDDVAGEPAEHSMEFTLPPGELDRIFVETKLRARQLEAAPAETAPPEAAPAELEPPPEPAPHPESAAHLESAAHPESTDRTRSGLEVSEDVRRDMLAGFEQALEPQFDVRDSGLGNSRRRIWRLILWLGAALAAALLLLAQIAHRNPEWPVVRALYGVLGTPLAQPATLSAYQLRQWGVSGDPDANATLRLRASILNTAAQLQPYPLLRVTLADRFGKSIGTRDFEPAEYLGKPTVRLLAPGERIDATLNILDPGKNAEGFEIDVCLRAADGRVACANDAAAQTTPAAQPHR
jgi:predicted Zn finger-like uncharacterized protein